MKPSGITLRALLRWPAWLVSVLGGGHDFRGNPIIGSSFLNRLGLHVMRLLLAHAVAGLRRACLRGLVSARDRACFRRDGFILIHDLLSPAELAELRAEIARADGEFRECQQGDTLTQRLLLDSATLGTLPVMRRLLHDPAFTGALRYVASSARRPHFYLQAVRNSALPGGPDPQKTLHSDTFQPCMKAWYFPEAVGEDDGPFTYVPGSHRLDFRRLRWEYRRSLVAARLEDGYSEKGSFRVSPKDLEELGLPPPLAVCVPANTLVVADTCGIHCRGQASPGAKRIAIWAFSRRHPFNPWPGMLPAVFDRWELAVARRRWRRLDASAARLGQRSSWHPVSAEAFHAGSGEAPLSRPWINPVSGI